MWCAAGLGVGTFTFNIYVNDFPLEISKIFEVIMFVGDNNIEECRLHPDDGGDTFL
jgi:hypothetical protein